MKMLFPKIACLCLALFVYCNSKTTPSQPQTKSFKLSVERGAFHNDTFILSSGKVAFLPEKNSTHSEKKYTIASETRLDTTMTLKFITAVERRGFWKLKNRHKTNASCSSGLIVTLVKNKKTKRIFCDDFNKDCPELLKYIEQKMVEMEGNNLKRIYLPG